MPFTIPRALVLTGLVALLATSNAIPQEKSPAPAKPAAAGQDATKKTTEEPTNIDELALSQSRLADKYSRL